MTEAMLTRFVFACLSSSFKLSSNSGHLHQAAPNHKFGKCQHLLGVLVVNIGELIGEGDLKLGPRFSSRGLSKGQHILET